MSKSGAERIANLRERRKAEGKENLNIWIDSEIVRELENISKTGSSKDDRINTALLILLDTRREYGHLSGAFNQLQREYEELKAQPQSKPKKASPKSKSQAFDVNDLEVDLAVIVSSITIDGLWSSDRNMKASALKLIDKGMTPVCIVDSVIQMGKQEVDDTKRTRLRKKLADWKRAAKA